MSIQDYFDQSCEDEVEKDYRVARGILGWQEGDEPAEDSTRRLRDGDDSEYQRLERENARLKAYNAQLVAKAKGEPIVLNGDETPEQLSVLLIDRTSPLTKEDIESGLVLAAQIAETENAALKAERDLAVRVARKFMDLLAGHEGDSRVMVGEIEQVVAWYREAKSEKGGG